MQFLAKPKNAKKCKNASCIFSPPLHNAVHYKTMALGETQACNPQYGVFFCFVFVWVWLLLIHVLPSGSRCAAVAPHLEARRMAPAGRCALYSFDVYVHHIEWAGAIPVNIVPSVAVRLWRFPTIFVSPSNARDRYIRCYCFHRSSSESRSKLI